MEAGIGVSQPAAIRNWFRARGWRPYAHQLAMWRAAEAGRSALLVAPTGGGKTLAGFLPSIAELATGPRPGLHTLYISPLKALAVDIHRNLEAPIAEMGLDIAVETRTGDTPQRRSPAAAGTEGPPLRRAPRRTRRDQTRSNGLAIPPTRQ